MSDLADSALWDAAVQETAEDDGPDHDACCNSNGTMALCGTDITGWPHRDPDDDSPTGCAVCDDLLAQYAMRCPLDGHWCIG